MAKADKCGPIVVAVMATVIGGFFLRDTKDVDIKLGSGVEAAQRP